MRKSSRWKANKAVSLATHSGIGREAHPSGQVEGSAGVDRLEIVAGKLGERVMIERLGVTADLDNFRLYLPVLQLTYTLNY